jgi:hypothetical protein
MHARQAPESRAATYFDGVHIPPRTAHVPVNRPPSPLMLPEQHLLLLVASDTTFSKPNLRSFTSAPQWLPTPADQHKSNTCSTELPALTLHITVNHTCAGPHKPNLHAAHIPHETPHAHVITPHHFSCCNKIACTQRARLDPHPYAYLPREAPSLVEKRVSSFPHHCHHLLKAEPTLVQQCIPMSLHTS